MFSFLVDFLSFNLLMMPAISYLQDDIMMRAREIGSASRIHSRLITMWLDVLPKMGFIRCGRPSECLFWPAYVLSRFGENL